LTSFIAFSNSWRGTRSTTSPYISMKRRRQSFAKPFAREPSEALHRARRQAEVQDRVHHPRHGRARPGADRDEKRIARVAEAFVGVVLEPRERGLDLRADAVEAGSARHVRAHRGLDRETRRHGDAEGRHLGEARALAAQSLLAEARALGDAVSK
jgi:hypothetical protein